MLQCNLCSNTQVVLLFLSGLTLSLTAQCTFGDKRSVKPMDITPLALVHHMVTNVGMGLNNGHPRCKDLSKAFMSPIMQSLSGVLMSISQGCYI